MGTVIIDPFTGKYIREIEYAPVYNWGDWPKREPDNLSRLVNVLPELVKRVEALETHLASGAKTPFVQPSNRFSTDVQEHSEVLNSLHTRLEALEKTLGAKTPK
jgi:hypothetical protein